VVSFFQQDPHKSGMNYASLYANHKPFNIPQAEWKAACQGWVNDHFKNGAYFKINGKPLFVVFSVREMEHAWGGPQGVAQGRNELRAVAEEAGLPGVFVIACANPGPKNSRTNLDTLASEGYDAYSGYNYVRMPGTVNGETPYSLLVQGSLEIWNNFAADSRKPNIPVVTDGWDSRPWNETPPQFADKRRGPVGKVVSEALNALAESELEVRIDFAGNKKISPLRCGMPLHSQHETKKTLTHGIAHAF
jgi:hypothetical protein